MIRFVAFFLAVAFVSSAQAIPLMSSQSPDGVIVAVREGCGAGLQRVGNRCVRNTAVRKVRRCVAGYRLVGGRCIR